MTQGCLELEMLAAFVDGKLSRRERRTLTEHLASCEECCTVLAEAIREREARGERAVVRPASRRTLWIAAASIAATLVASVAWRFGHVPTGPAPVLRGIGPLVSVPMDKRPLDARVTGGFNWLPLAPLERSGESPRTTPTWELLAAASRIRQDAERDPSPENRHALGVAHLVMGDLDEAVTVLRSVITETASDATALNDLGAALLARGEAQARPDDVIEALSSIDRALEVNGNLPEARFNRAVALEKLHLDEKAEAAWEDYLGRDPEPGWAEEARRRLAELKRPKASGEWKNDRERLERAADDGDASTVREIVARRTQETRLLIQDELLGSWARAADGHREADAQRALAAAGVLAAALKSATGDAMTEEIVTATRETASRGASARLDQLIRGHLAYQDGVERAKRYELADAEPYFERAEDALEAAGSPLALWASLGRAQCAYFQREIAGASRAVDAVLAEAERRGYAPLTARAQWMRGLLDVFQNRVGDSLAHYQRSLAIFEKLREDEHAAFVSSLVAENLAILGDERESLRSILASLARVRSVKDPGRVVSILMQAGYAASRQGFPDVAMQFQDAAVESATREGDPIDIGDSLQRRAQIASELRRFDGAQADVAEARSWVPHIADPGMRARIDAEVRFTEGQLARRSGDGARADGVLTKAIAFFAQAGLDARLPELYLERGRAARSRGDIPAAERDLKAGIEIFERHRKEILEQPLRVSYFDTAHDLFDELMGLEVARGRSDAALVYLERGKSKDLLDGWRTAKPFAVESLANAVPADVIVVAYGALPDRLLVWTITRGSRALIEKPSGADDLSQLVKRFRDELEGREPEPDPETAARLYEVLIGPIASRLAEFGTVVFVPDEALHAVPFAALTNAKTSRFLVEDHAIVVAPSLALFLHATDQRSLERSEAPPTLLAVGDPAFDAAAFPHLSRLSGAAKECERIAKLYPDAVVLTGENATRRSFLSAVGEHTIIHVASHALTNDSDPLRSRLLLAPDPERGDSGTLFAQDLYGRTFGEARLVVLAACATGSGRISRGEGPLSLARPFLAGGVPAVVATLWEIEDAPSAHLLTVFHRQIAAGRPPEDALRDAQVAMIQSNDPALRSPRAWAAFQFSGGVDRSVRG